MIDLLEQHRDAIAALCRKHHVKRLDVFGSANRDDFDPVRSDIDVIAEFDPDYDEPWIANRFRFQDELSGIVHRKVDLLMTAEVRNPYLRRSIEESRETLYAA